MNIKKVRLDQLFLDPNNYRLRSNPAYKLVADKNIANEMVQRRTLRMLAGDNSEQIRDLMDSFRENGYLRLDNIIVKPLPETKKMAEPRYLVIEGNRRTATLKAMQKKFQDGMEIGHLDADCFENLEVVVYSGTEQEYAIIMGLRHVTGIKEWGDYEQSVLIANLVREYGMSERNIAERLGISVQRVTRRLHTYYALQIFQDNKEYGEYYRADQFSAIFYEIMGRPDIRDAWLHWDGTLHVFMDKKNMQRLFSWLVPDEDESGNRLDPIITKRNEIRDLAKFIADEEALEAMEENRSVHAGLEMSQYDSKAALKKNLKQIISSLDRLNLGMLTDLEDEDKSLIREMLQKITTRGSVIGKLI